MRTRSLRTISVAALIAWLLGGVAAFGGPYGYTTRDRWRPYPNLGLLDEVTLRMHWLEGSDELHDAARALEQELNPIGLFGFSILRRNASTGEYVCDVYALRMTGKAVDKDRTTTFGHEVLHCFGLKHD